MASTRPAASFLRPTTLRQARRSFQTSRPLLADVVITPPARRPVGAFRGTLFGFLLGSVLAGGGLYYYVIDEYKVSNELLTEDIYALQAAVQRLEVYVKGVEEEVKTSKK
ncbi:hypothetical protein B0A54_05083 [Friedmanniomyces endolithicus]|uniref:Uncharacterized protein n=1 Tax=Friedmanniomyces endolithicus TaxID=329885 RepID=A0A4U0V6E0_9PEZI|nr:hypothetical protein B0A54_05083 [Friedmanniomyces endolithicus]